MTQQEFSCGGGSAVAIFREIAPKGKGYVLAQTAGQSNTEAVEAATEALLEAGASSVFLRPLGKNATGQSCRMGRFEFVYDSGVLWMEAPLKQNVEDPRVTFEPLAQSNGDAYLSLYNTAFYEVPNSATYGPDDLKRLLTDQKALGAIVCVWHERAGVLELLVNGPVPSIEGVGLVPRFRGKGLGRALLRSVMGMLARKNYSRVSLMVSTSNTPALRLYISEGFACTRIVSRWFRLSAAGGRNAAGRAACPKEGS